MKKRNKHKNSKQRSVNFFLIIIEQNFSYRRRMDLAAIFESNGRKASFLIFFMYYLLLELSPFVTHDYIRWYTINYAIKLKKPLLKIKYVLQYSA